MMMLIVLLVMGSCLVFWLHQRISRRSTDPPTLPGSLPIIGHAHYVLFGDINKLYDLLEFITQVSLKAGGVTSTSFGPFKVYVLSDPEVSMAVMDSCLEKDIFYDFWKPWMGNGLLTAPYNLDYLGRSDQSEADCTHDRDVITDSIAKSHRKMLLPAFNQRALDAFIPVFNRQAGRLTDRIAEHVDKEPFDILPYLTVFGLQSILFTACGQAEWDKVALNEYLDAIQKIHRVTIERFKNVLLHVDFLFNRSGLKKRQDEIVKVLHNMSTEVIERRRSIILVGKDNDKTASDDEMSGINSNNKRMVDILLEYYEKGDITYNEMIDEISTTIFGGHDTSAGTLLYTLVLLGSHPEIQDRVYTELQNIFGNSDDDVMKQDYSKLVYMEAVIKESMRLYPFLSYLARTIDKDLITKNYTLRAGSRCLILVMGMHRHSSWGPNPEEFRPERWLEPGGLPSCPAAFAGFSWGKRGCVGKTYAMMTMKTTMAHLIRRYRFTSEHSKLRFKFEVVIKPESGHYVSIERRT